MAERRIEGNFRQGWGFALLILLLAGGAFAAAGFIKSRTFHSPTDPLAPAGAEAPAAKH